MSYIHHEDMDPVAPQTPSPIADNSQTSVMPASSSQFPLDGTSIAVILLLLFMYPIGLLVMIFGTKWQRWVKVVAALPLVFVVLTGIMVGYLANTVLGPQQELQQAKLRALLTPAPTHVMMEDTEHSMPILEATPTPTSSEEGSMTPSGL